MMSNIHIVITGYGWQPLLTDFCQYLIWIKSERVVVCPTGRAANKRESEAR
jgi:hypothetical protein